MKELSSFKRINLLKCCDIGSRMTHFGLPRVNTMYVYEVQTLHLKYATFIEVVIT
jgi:hypothetical protein